MEMPCHARPTRQKVVTAPTKHRRQQKQPGAYIVDVNAVLGLPLGARHDPENGLLEWVHARIGVVPATYNSARGRIRWCIDHISNRQASHCVLTAQPNQI